MLLCATYGTTCIQGNITSFILASKMKTSKFYHQLRYIKQIPDGSSDSELSDDDEEPKAFSTQILVAESDSNSDCSDDENDLLVIPASDEEILSEDEDNIPLAVRIEQLNKKKKSNLPKKSYKPIRHKWLEENLSIEDDQLQFRGSLDLPTDISSLDTPYQFFNFLFPKSIITYITDQSNLYASQIRPNNLPNISEKEIEQFIGILLKMSISSLPSIRHHWGVLGHPSVYNVMPVNRFEEIKRFMHFNDNTTNTPETYDRLFKVKPLLDQIKNILITIPKEEYLAVDEQIIPTKCKTSLKQYNPKKPHKWGYKVFVLSGVSGFSYDFDIFAGEQTNKMPDNCPTLSTSSNMVIKMAYTIPRQKNYKLFFDNWFTSLPLMVYLDKEGILPLGTARLNRIAGLIMPNEKEFKKLGRGSMCEKTTTIDNVKVSAVSWFDNKVVTMVSTYVGSQPTVEKQRFFRSLKMKKMVTCPKAVDVYNQYMGGVDLLDSMLGYYRISLKSRKYYMKIFYHMVDLCVVNAWLLYRRVHPDTYIPLVDFKLIISEVLCEVLKPSPRRKGRPLSSENTTQSLYNAKRRRRGPCSELPAEESRLDGMDHLPIQLISRSRCKYPTCKSKTMASCIKCALPLCFNQERNCFLLFHTQ